ncbi:hypothetical protein [Pseudonocardia acaciae]|uniref:hypothetical protein n=1 Tax=Pseudonocardia acaciae TaxID=551276 RepID=UPI0012EE3EDE|nr:hypothetical protein [Pseudonocardia acaciae]
MPEGREAVDVTVETHTLLLSLAGLIDDELLGWCRELVAVGEGDYAIELATSTVQADRVRLPPGPHDALAAAAGRRQLLVQGESLPPADTSPRMRHRFLADPATGGFPAAGAEHDPEAALRTVPGRLLRDCQVLLVWRTTPAGGAPGPLPHPLVLIETAETAGADVLAYQVGEVLARAGVFASVEVFAAEHQLGDYHRAALAEARRLELVDTGPPAGGSGGGGPLPRRQPAGRPEQDPRNRDGRDNRDKQRRPDKRRASGSGSGQEASARDETRRAPLRPVDRVITARGSAPLRPQPDRSDLDDGPGRERSPFPPDGADGSLEDEPPGDRPAADRRGGDRPRDGLWNSPRDLPALPPSQEPPGPNASGGFPAAGGAPGNGRPQARQSQPKRQPARADEANLPDTPPGLSDVEQRLLRQLHEELAAREDGDSHPEQHSGQMFRSTNGGRKPRGPRQLGPPDQAG